MPRRILQLIAEKRRAWKRWQRTGIQEDKLIWNALVKQVKQEIQEHCNSTWTNRLNKLSHKDNSLWKMTKMLKNTKEVVPSLKFNNTVLLTDSEKAEALSNAFLKAHDLDLTNLAPDQKHITNIAKLTRCTHYPIPNRTLQKYLTNPNELKKLAKTFSNDKTPGLDGITYRLIKNISNKAYCQLSYIVNAVLALQHYPRAWKQAAVIPIAKPGKEATSPENYRPISLLSGLSKLTEKVNLHRLDKIENRLKIVPNEQFGFKTFHSTTHQVARIVTDIKTNFNKGQNTVLMLLDMQKAFDKVWIDGLVYKL